MVDKLKHGYRFFIRFTMLLMALALLAMPELWPFLVVMAVIDLGESMDRSRHA
jgi:hypothetical protein